MTFSPAFRGAKSVRAFTLIELMIVVVIIGVLASLGIYSVNQYLDNAKVAEAREIIGATMAGQEAFFDETGRYLDVTGGVTDADFYPVDAAFNGSVAIQWGGESPSCTGEGGATCRDNFFRIGVMVNSAVRFRYASTTFAAGAAPPLPGTFLSGYNPGDVKAPRPGYIVVALTNLDGQNDGDRTALAGSSLQANIHLQGLGN